MSNSPLSVAATNAGRSLAVSALGGATLASTALADAGEAAGGWIDAHSHLWTSDVLKFPLAAGVSVDELAPRDFLPEDLIALGKPLGVERYVLIQHKPYHGLDNSYLLDVMTRFPGLFSTVACIEAAGPSPELDMRRLAAHGVRGFRIRPVEGGTRRWRGSPGMAAMWGCAAETGLAICPLINPEALPETTVMCERFPETPVVIDHFARIGIDGEIREADVQALCNLSRFSKVCVKISAFYALGRKAPPYDDLVPMIRRLYDSFGPRRLMWATDCPYQLATPNSYRASFERVHEHLDFLSAADRKEILRGTAERLFFGAVNL